jgi:pyruvate kinase
MKKTKVVCTIGPASEQKEMLVKLINAGMNVMRMNFSHGDHEEQGFRIKNVKALNEEMGWNIGIALDTKGPEIRTGYLKDDKPVDLVAGETIRITMDYSYLGDEKKVAISYPGLYNDLQVGNTVLFEDGNINLTVIEKDEENQELVCRINNNRKLKNKRNCDIPGVVLNMPFITQKEIRSRTHFPIVVLIGLAASDPNSLQR